MQIFIRALDPKGPPQAFQRVRTRGFIQRDPQLGLADPAQVNALIHRRFQDRALQWADFDSDGVKEIVGFYHKPCVLQTAHHTHGFAVNALRDCL